MLNGFKMKLALPGHRLVSVLIAWRSTSRREGCPSLRPGHMSPESEHFPLLKLRSWR